MTYATTLKDVKRIAQAENAQDVSAWNHKDLTALRDKIKDKWFSASVYGLGALVAVDYNGNYYYASSRSGAIFVLA